MCAKKIPQRLVLPRAVCCMFHTFDKSLWLWHEISYWNMKRRKKKRKSHSFFELYSFQYWRRSVLLVVFSTRLLCIIFPGRFSWLRTNSVGSDSTPLVSDPDPVGIASLCHFQIFLHRSVFRIYFYSTVTCLERGRNNLFKKILLLLYNKKKFFCFF